MKKSIGIDLGTTNSVIAFKDTQVKIVPNHESEELTRSCVALVNGELVVGRTAFQMGLGRDPENTVLSVKRLMGGAIKDKMVQEMIANKDYYKYQITDLKGGTDEAVAIILGGKQYTPEQISAEIIKKLKRDAEEKLGEEVSHAVITVPAYFTEKQKNATRLAAQSAGLKVQKILAEPTAAAIAYGVDNIKPGEAKTVLIYDFGGGTFDLSILNIVDGQFMEAGTGGDRWLGGDDIDRKLQEFIIERVQDQYKIKDLRILIDKLPQKRRYQFNRDFRIQSEQVKIQLGSTSTANIDISNILEDENGEIIDIDIKISRQDLEKIAKPLIQRTIDLIDQLLNELHYDMSMIDSILMVGGSSCIPLVKKMLVEKFGIEKIKLSEKPMLIVAEGAGILSQKLGEEYEAATGISSSIDEVSYCTNHNYYIQLSNDEGNFTLEKIIDKQVPLPHKTQKIFRTTVNKQKIAHIKFFSDVENNNYEQMTQGFYTIDDELPARSELIFSIGMDINEIFSITAYSKTNKNKEKSIVLSRGNKDAKTLNFIAEHLEKMSSDKYSQIQQEHFYKAVQKEIDKINNLSFDQPDSEIWGEIGTSIFTSFEKTESMAENIDELGFAVIFGVILCREYSMLIHSQDNNQLNKLLKQYNDCSDSFEKTHISEQIKAITDEYPVLLGLYTVKMAAENAQKSNPADATRLLQIHDTVVSHFRNGNNDKAFELLDEALILRENYFSGFETGTGISQ